VDGWRKEIERKNCHQIGYVFLRNCFLKRVIEEKIAGRIEVMGRRGKRRKQLLDDLKEKRLYWILKKETFDLTQLRTCFGRGHGPDVRQTAE
jgi:hypothetical protein